MLGNQHHRQLKKFTKNYKFNFHILTSVKSDSNMKLSVLLDNKS